MSYNQIERLILYTLRNEATQVFVSVNDKSQKVGPRGIKIVFVGYAEHFNACRLLNLYANVQVESRDVEFIEDKFVNLRI